MNWIAKRKTPFIAIFVFFYLDKVTVDELHIAHKSIIFRSEFYALTHIHRQTIKKGHTKTNSVSGHTCCCCYCYCSWLLFNGERRCVCLCDACMYIGMKINECDSVNRMRNERKSTTTTKTPTTTTTPTTATTVITRCRESEAATVFSFKQSSQ